MTGEPENPYDLPRQRRGTTPQMHGRYPDYDVLEEARHWDEVTRRVVFERVENVPEIRFFDPLEAATLQAFCDVLLAQDAEPRIPVLNYVDAELASGVGDGYRYYDLPEDGETWRLVARGLDEQARQERFGSYAAAPHHVRLEICDRFAQSRLHGGSWSTLNVSRAWSVVTRYALEAFYAHPWAWNEIGFGGPAYPRGYARFGSPHLAGAEREFFTDAEAATLTALCDNVLAQDSEPRIPVLAFVDAKHAAGKTEGYRYADMPPDGETWRLVARGLDEAAGGGAGMFAEIDADARAKIVEAFAAGEVEGGAWAELDVSRAWSVVTRDALSVFYAHPWAWNEIGFGGPAYPRGYMRLGVDQPEPWGGHEATGLARDFQEDVEADPGMRP